MTLALGDALAMTVMHLKGFTRTDFGRLHPGGSLGARLKPVFSSDLSHWDVPEMDEVVEEAHGLVRKGILTEQDFREFVFENPAKLLLQQNPDFFVGTAAESTVHSSGLTA